ncbi:MAG: IPT/TIG domain-containing protein [Adhaeribacter sp.]
MKTLFYQFNRTKGNSPFLPRLPRTCLVLLIWVCFIPAALSQTKAWDQTFGGDNNDALTCLQPTRDGGYLLAGTSFSGISGDKTGDNRGQCDPSFCSSDYWLVKIDSAGTKVWDKTIGGNQTDILTALQPTADGGFILGGYSNSGAGGDKSQDSRGSYDYWVVKIDSAGNKQWDKTFGGDEAEGFAALHQTADGGYILGGYSSSSKSEDKTENSRGDYDYWVLKLDSTGTRLWDKVYGGSGEDKLAALITTRDGGFLLGGFADSDSSADKSADARGSFDYWLVKIDAQGNKTWDKTLGGDKTDILTALLQSPDGSYLAGGYSPSGITGEKSEASKGMTDFWVLKLDPQGSIVWDKTLGGTGAEVLNSLQAGNDGGYLLGGYSDSGIGGNKSQASLGLADMWVLKLDATGYLAWDRTFGGSATDGLAALHQASDGSFLLGGWSDSGIGGDKSQAPAGRTDFWVLKLSSALAPPQLLAFSPAKGLPGTKVTIVGRNLLTTRAVRFQGLKAKFVVLSDDKIQATVPAKAVSGKITIETTAGKVHNSPPFTVLQPEIAAFIPFRGKPGTTVFLVGNRLSTAKEVYFNGVKSPRVKVYFDWAMTAVVPEGATTGTLRVWLKHGGEDTTKTAFVVLPADGLPAVPELSPLEQTAALALSSAGDLSQVMVFPNPFTDQLQFGFTAKKSQPVRVEVYNLMGRQVALLYEGDARAWQAYLLTWRPGTQLPGGLYLIRLQAPGQVLEHKVMLSR